jgi:hypothetical protein
VKRRNSKCRIEDLAQTDRDLLLRASRYPTWIPKTKIGRAKAQSMIAKKLLVELADSYVVVLPWREAAIAWIRRQSYTRTLHNEP